MVKQLRAAKALTQIFYTLTSFNCCSILQSSWNSWKEWSNPEQEKIQSVIFYISLWLGGHV